MMSTKAWYSFTENEDFKGPEPAFFAIDNKPWKALLENNFHIILSELQQIIDNDNKNVVPYYNATLASNPKAWTIFPLRFWGKENSENKLKAPQTVDLIDKIEGVTSYGFSILKANSSIKPHYGDSNVMYRCHLTLKSSGTINEIGMRVANEKTEWINGQLFAFCDAHNHEVWNHTNEDRWVLIIDILREEFLKQEKQICQLVNATLWWQLKFQKNYFLKHLPKWSRGLLMRVTARFMYDK